jgi:EAL domain-containing protein (putative c-di-GMP-specific phosphodiesterase class I)
MDKDEKSHAIVKTILMLGENLGIEVVAEGIETETQLELLLSLGCSHGQGYLFSHPIDAARAERLLCEPTETTLHPAPDTNYSGGPAAVQVPSMQ